MSDLNDVQNYKYLEKELKIAINENDKKLVTNLIEKINIADLAITISEYNHEEKLAFVNIIDDNFPADLFLKLHNSVSEEFIQLIGPKKSAKIIQSLESPEILSILEEVSEVIRNQIRHFFNKETKEELKTGFSYPENSAGRLMQRNFISVPKHWNISQTIKYCCKNKEVISNNFYGVFVVDPYFKPIGIITSKDLIINDPKTIVENIMNKEVISFNYLTEEQELAMNFKKYDLSFAPIVNNDGRMLGFTTQNTAIEVIEESVSDDILHLGGIIESDIYTKFIQTIKQRFPWLFLNLITAIIASIVISIFDKNIEAIVALAVLMPIIASMGGNAGTQTVTIAVRSLARKELTAANSSKIILKEFLIGITNGIFFSIISFLLITITYDIKLAILFSIATVITLGIAGLSGAIIPIIVYRLKGDPAISSGVILTTITDVIAFLSFLGLASLII
ncbi:MAG: magnesium transporter [Rickettsiales bacterium]|nr:magnesium transporter [Rickettsiales bacterium]